MDLNLLMAARGYLYSHAINGVIRNGFQNVIIKGLELMRHEETGKTNTKADQYSFGVGGRLADLTTAFDRCIFAVAEIGNASPLKPPFISGADLLSYQVENLNLRVVGLLDRCLHLVNEIAQLKIESRSLKQRVVVQHERIASTGIAVALVRINDAVHSLRLTRNSFVHEETLSTRELSFLNVHDRHYLDRGETDMLCKADQVREDFVRASVSEAERVLCSVAEAIKDLLDALLPIAMARTAGE